MGDREGVRDHPAADLCHYKFRFYSPQEPLVGVEYEGRPLSSGRGSCVGEIHKNDHILLFRRRQYSYVECAIPTVRFIHWECTHVKEIQIQRISQIYIMKIIQI